MNSMACLEMQPGRLFVGRLPYNQDLITSIENFCKKYSIDMASFSIIGAVSSVTIGSYDQKQQVYVSHHEKAHLEILTCTGNISLKEGTPVAHAHIVLCDIDGKTTGGHLFSDTIVFAAEIKLQELVGKTLERVYDNNTGLMLWDL